MVHQVRCQAKAGTTWTRHVHQRGLGVPNRSSDLIMKMYAQDMAASTELEAMPDLHVIVLG